MNSAALCGDNKLVTIVEQETGIERMPVSALSPMPVGSREGFQA